MKYISDDEDKRLRETRLGREEIFNGKVLHLVRDDVCLSNGVKTRREVILHNGAVCVVALTDGGGVLLERQFRYPFDKVIWEIPAGKLDTADEDPLSAAGRELMEETGYIAGEMRFLGEYYGSPAILGEKIYMYLATGLVRGEKNPDEDELIDVVEIPLGEAVRMISENEIPDGKTQTAILRTLLLEGDKK